MLGVAASSGGAQVTAPKPSKAALAMVLRIDADAFPLTLRKTKARREQELSIIAAAIDADPGLRGLVEALGQSRRVLVETLKPGGSWNRAELQRLAAQMAVAIVGIDAALRDWQASE